MKSDPDAQHFQAKLLCEAFGYPMSALPRNPHKSSKTYLAACGCGLRTQKLASFFLGGWGGEGGTFPLGHALSYHAHRIPSHPASLTKGGGTSNVGCEPSLAGAPWLTGLDTKTIYIVLTLLRHIRANNLVFVPQKPFPQSAANSQFVSESFFTHVGGRFHGTVFGNAELDISHQS
jgi:hypothetical protein